MAARSPRSGARALTSVLVILAFAGSWACPPVPPPPPPPVPPPPPPPPPQVTRLEISPQAVQAPINTSFELSVTAFDADNRVVPIVTPGAVAWTITPPGDLIPTYQLGAIARFRVPSGSLGDVKLKAVLGAGIANAIVSVTPATIGQGDDIFKAGHTGDAPPVVAVVRSARGAEPVDDELVAFVSTAQVPDLTAPGTVAVFSRDEKMAYLPETWSAGQQTTDVSAVAKPPVNVALRIWDATDAGLLTFRDLETVNLVFTASRTGIRFTGPAGGPVRLPGTSVSINDCVAPEVVFPGIYDPKLAELHVFFVESLTGIWYGWTCPADPDPTRPARAIFIAAWRNTTTLAHELGHATALLDPPHPIDGHADCIGGLGEDNLMMRWLSDAGNANRLSLSVGQVFRIAADQRSWVTLNGWGGIGTAPLCSDGTNPCPPIPHPSRAPDGWELPWWCKP